MNGTIVDVPSYRVKEGTVIEVRDKYKANAMMEDAIKLSKAIDTVPEWVEVDFEKRIGKVSRIPDRKDVTANFNEQLVVELYSK